MTTGTPGDDTLVGTAGADTISGLGGNDHISGLGGDDNLNGNSGNDTVLGGDGNDTINGGGGADILNGDAGNDTITGGNGNDTIYGGTGNDTIEGNGGADIVYGEEGDDFIRGQDLVDILDGGSGNDKIFAGQQNDTVTGGAGDDNLEGRKHSDTVYGGDGDDYIEGDRDDNVDSGDDTLSGGNGTDTVFGGDGADIITGGAGNDLLSGDDVDFDAYNGGSFLRRTGASDADPMGSGDLNASVSGDGADTIDGGLGDDTILGGGDDDLLTGGAGNDTLDGGTDSGSATGDIAVFTGRRADYKISYDGSGSLTVQDMYAGDGDDGTDVLSGIETLRFIDGDISAPLPGGNPPKARNGKIVMPLGASAAEHTVFIDDSDANDTLTISLIGDTNQDGAIDITNANGETIGTIQLISSSGTPVAQNSDGRYRFSPASGCSGVGSFDYNVSDSSGLSTVASMDIEIIDSWSPPIDAGNITATTGVLLTSGSPDDAKDGDPTTEVVYDQPIYSGEVLVSYDLGAIRSLDRVDLSDLYQPTFPNTGTDSVRIETSVDGVTWTDYSGAIETTGTKQDHSFTTDVTARHVRLVANQNASSLGISGLDVHEARDTLSGVDGNDTLSSSGRPAEVEDDGRRDMGDDVANWNGATSSSYFQFDGDGSVTGQALGTNSRASIRRNEVFTGDFAVEWSHDTPNNRALTGVYEVSDGDAEFDAGNGANAFGGDIFWHAEQTDANAWGMVATTDAFALGKNGTDASTNFSYQSGDVFRLERIGVTFTLYKNDAFVHEYSDKSSEPVRLMLNTNGDGVASSWHNLTYFNSALVTLEDPSSTLLGGAGDDLLVGGDGDDTLNGGADTDTLDGGAGDDLLDGGDGASDVAVFAGNKDGFSIEAIAGGGYRVIDVDASNGDLGTDTLTNVETLSFDNGDIDLTIIGDGPSTTDGRIGLTASSVVTGVLTAAEPGQGTLDFIIDGTKDPNGWVALAGGGKVRLLDGAGAGVSSNTTGLYEFDGTGASGTDTFTFRVTGPNGLSASGHMDVSVGPVTPGVATVIDPNTLGGTNTVSPDGLEVSSTGSSGVLIFGTTVLSGKQYWEITNLGAQGQVGFGVAQAGASPSGGLPRGVDGWCIYNDEVHHNGTKTHFGSPIQPNDVIMIATDTASGKIWFGVNGSWVNGGNPETGANASFSNLSGTLLPAFGTWTSNPSFRANFGGSSFSYTPPASFETLDTDGSADLSSSDGSDVLVGGTEDDSISGGLGDDKLAGEEGDDTLVGGEGADTTSGGTGNDTWEFSSGEGQDTILNDGMDASSTDTLKFLSSLTRDDLWFAQEGDDLRIDILGANDRTTLKDWYASGSSSDTRMDRIEAGGEVLVEAHLQSLVNAMAAWSANNGGQDGDDLTSMPNDSTLDAAIVAAWQTIS